MEALTIERPEVAAAAQAIGAERERLQAAFDAATESLESRIAERAAVERHYARLMLAANLASQRIGELSAAVKSATQAAVLAIIDSIEQSPEVSGGAWEPRQQISFRPLANIEPAIHEMRRGQLFTENLAFHIEHDQELCQFARAAELEAEAIQVEALADMRGYELELSLLPIAEQEGALLVDRNSGVTHELKKKAAGLRLQAAGIHEQIAEAAQKRKGI